MTAKNSVFLLGGYGQTGRVLAELLLEHLEVNVVIAGRRREPAQRLAAQLCDRFGEGRALPVTVEASNKAAVRRALEGSAVFVQAGPALPENVVASLAETVLEADAHWIDVQITPSQARTLRQYEARIREKGLIFAVQSGYHPGLPAVLARYAHSRFDRLASAHIGTVIKPKGGFKMSQGMAELFELFRDFSPYARHYRDGRWVEMDFKDLRAYTENMRSLDFPFGMGRKRCLPMLLEELQDLPAQWPELRELGFWMAGMNPVADWLVTPLIMAKPKLLPFVQDEALGEMLALSTKWFTPPPYGVVMLLEAKGERDGQRKKLRLGLAHADEYLLTAAPMAATIRQMLAQDAGGAGSASEVRPDAGARAKRGQKRTNSTIKAAESAPESGKSGVLYAARFVDPETLLADIRTMGVRIMEREEALP